VTKDIEEISRAFNLVSAACWNIKESDQCGHCPMRFMCLEGNYGTTSVIDVADMVSTGTWSEFLDYADKCLPSEELQADMDYARGADYGRDEL
jgi:hypothetical protein